MYNVDAYAAQTETSPLAPFSFPRRDPLPNDVQFDVLFCGVCHSDLHTARNEWGGFSKFPCVPGHEIVGRVTKVGGDVSRFKVGDLCAVGCMVDSCRTCHSCKDGLENYCEPGAVFTYNSDDPHGTTAHTFGGYSTAMTINEDFVLRVPENLDPAATAPLLCAGITTYSPLAHWKVTKGQKVGIVGLGGLGHMGLKFAHAMGAHTVLFTTSPGKADDARRLGADEVVISRDPSQMEKQANSFDFILDTVSASHDINEYLNMLHRDGTMCLVGAPEHPHPPLQVMGMIFKRRRLVGSLIGGIRETQEMLDFCAKHNIVSDIEMIRMDQINEAYERMLKSDVKYRFVIDLNSLRK
ncbi:MAG: NAD(P)-dependent alcohol dehydrogenase [Phycisphaeraceae bacterium]|nr:NAD(P)-dependent alcohol dehydrogenase [Phycisphaerales bacterium]MCB9859328.1 NAD(P)-dependent alcohol dehydrogenase [Phycisphaeraceae bacterium]